MSDKTAKHYSEAKYSRIERKYTNGSRYHKICVKRYNRSDRQSIKATLKTFVD